MPTQPSIEVMSSRFKHILEGSESSEDERNINEGKEVETQEQDTIGD